MMRTVFLLLLSSTLLIAGCKYSKRSSVYYDYETQCMGVGKKGTTLLKVYSYAKKSRRAIELAKKHAVHAVIFKGIPNGPNPGQSGCMDRGLARDANAEQEHRMYFERFFSDNGQYLNFVSISNDGSIAPGDRQRVGKKLKIGVQVVVMHESLRKQLEADKIITGLNSGF
jgi:hypothetical protein